MALKCNIGISQFLKIKYLSNFIIGIETFLHTNNYADKIARKNYSSRYINTYIVEACIVCTKRQFFILFMIYMHRALKWCFEGGWRAGLSSACSSLSNTNAAQTRHQRIAFHKTKHFPARIFVFT